MFSSMSTPLFKKGSNNSLVTRILQSIYARLHPVPFDLHSRNLTWDEGSYIL